MAAATIGCAPPPRGVPILTGAEAKSPALTPDPYSESSLCNAPEDLFNPGDVSRCCEPATSTPIGALTLANDVHLRVGSAEDACGLTPIDTIFARDPSLSPSERVRPGGQLMEVTW